MSNPKMKRRLRKKQYLDDFAVFGFNFSCEIDTNSALDVDGFFDGLIEIIESRNLLIGGVGSETEFSGYITSNKRYDSATDDDRDALSAWFDTIKGIENIKVDPLCDAHYGY